MVMGNSKISRVFDFAILLKPLKFDAPEIYRYMFYSMPVISGVVVGKLQLMSHVWHGCSFSLTCDGLLNLTFYFSFLQIFYVFMYYFNSLDIS